MNRFVDATAVEILIDGRNVLALRGGGRGAANSLQRTRFGVIPQITPVLIVLMAMLMDSLSGWLRRRPIKGA